MAAGLGLREYGEWAGGSGLSYVVAAGDVGSRLRLVVTATNAAGSSSAASAGGSVVVAAPVRPVNTTAPSVSWVTGCGSDGDGVAGGVVGQSPSLAYQWQRCDAAGSGCVDTGSGPGDRGLSYVVVAGDVGSTLRLVVTATNAAGSSSAASAGWFGGGGGAGQAGQYDSSVGGWVTGWWVRRCWGRRGCGRAVRLRRWLMSGSGVMPRARAA